MRTRCILAAIAITVAGGAPATIAQETTGQQAEAQPANVDADAIAMAERVVEALGGRERIAAIKTLRVVTHDPDSPGLKYEHLWSHDGGRVLKVHQGDYPPQITASANGLAWRQNAFDDEPSLASEDTATSARRSVHFHMLFATLPSLARERFQSFTIGEATEFNNASVVPLQFEYKGGITSGVIYVNADTMIPEGWQRFWPKQDGGRHTVLEIFHEWEAAEGVQFLRKWTSQSDMYGGSSPITVVETLEVNELDASDFEPPAALREQARRIAEAAKAEGDEPISLDQLDDDSREQATAVLDQLRSLDAATRRAALEEVKSELTLIADPQERLMIRYVIQELEAMLKAEGG